MTRAQRNAVAELILVALREPEAYEALQALARVLGEAAPIEVSPAIGTRLGALVWTSGTGAELVRIVVSPDLAGVRAEAAERVRRGLAAGEHVWQTGGPAAALGAAASLDAALRRAAALFDARLYFEVHEELEVVWRDAVGETRRALQGLLQVAVALHHAEAGNLASTRRLLESGRVKLAPHAPSWHGVAIGTLLEELRVFEAALSRNDVPHAPRLVVA
jgi:hypothetical protein